MSSYWQIAKREAKRRAQFSGYCWVWPNPNVDWKEPYLFAESSTSTRPVSVPETASRYGEGLPPEIQEPELTLGQRLANFENRIADLEEQLADLKPEQES
ncbi:TPA: hypothetical protein L3889_000515 [Pseudomonas aeruginosa]|uniref:hypothetical protein n=1 Tax=unclassified Pseudomonas TaxID=196821 RepID=UPI002157C428|nr:MULTISPECIES: hypothetical protein [unclassified Pseudomonas]HBN9515510.1 hypothetical protein [Pseudomonas aeruginosa]